MAHKDLPFMTATQAAARERQEANIATLSADLEKCDLEDYHDLIDHGGPYGDSLSDRLSRFVWAVGAGKQPSAELLLLVAGGVAASLDSGKLAPWSKAGVGRPKGISRDRLDAIAEVHFFRRLLPKYDQRKPMPLSALAARRGYASEKSVRELESESVPTSVHDRHYFADTIKWLVICEGLGPVRYSICDDALVPEYWEPRIKP